MTIEATVRKWGDSLGIIIPKEFVDEESLSAGDTVLVQIEKEADLSPFFGKCRQREKSTQAFKDELRQIWKK
ncbi:AbrB/MazE/SpoVT family DNA-binding domain-containing protein [Candidatus Woesearchaeota archaeon]|nr:AbrB/MazE/SpoVT family DNA-binding domain-containing protein [Candidatus Woesearchaeota archaeon]